MKRTETFKSSLSSDSKELAWFVSLADAKNGNPGRWLECCPKSPALTFTSKQFLVLLFYRFFLPSPCIIPGTRCSCAHSPILDFHGVHLTTGCGKDGFRHRTHDSIIHLIATLLVSAAPSILTIPSVLQMKMRKGNQDKQEADTMASSKTFQEILSKLVRLKRTDTFKSSLSSDSKE